jgi:hypothetical protein
MGIVFLLLLLAQFEPEPRFGVSILQEQQLARNDLVNAQADHQPGGQQTIRQEAADAVDATRGPSFAADQDESPQRGSGRPIPPLACKIQVATTACLSASRFSGC